MDEYSKAFEKYYLLRYGMDDDLIKSIIKNNFNDNFDDYDIKQLKEMTAILAKKNISMAAEQEVASGLAGN